MSFQVVIKDGARRDISEAYRHYCEISNQLGVDFLDRLDESFQRITSAPEAYARVFEEIRQMRIRRFPFVVSYLVESDRIVILAVLHGHRDPSEWQSRIE